MLSRIAEALFWMSRYVERAEDLARLVDVNLHLLLDLRVRSARERRQYWAPILRMAGEPGALAEGARERTIVAHLACDAGNPNSITACVTKARENARSVREKMSSEMWEQVNKMYLRIREATPAGIWREGPHQFFTEVKDGAHLFAGITDHTMNHDDGWRYIQMGKFLERAMQTARLIRMQDHLPRPSARSIREPVDHVQWMAVLKSCSGYEAYRQVYVAAVEPHKVLQFLILNEDFPRSIRFSLAAAQGALHAVAGRTKAAAAAADRLLDQLVAALPSDQALTGTAAGGPQASGGLVRALDAFEERCQSVCDEIAVLYFGYQREATRRAL